ncbi:MAG TPA: alpha-ketoacid dehydrogenase subunit beta [Stellaceae bacterium]|nr:alpha-ketoacid dehydrogenase subunit beta [Stellaceae bacterium]
MPEARQITYRAAVLEALFEEMRRDPAVIVMGEDVGAPGGVFKQTEGLYAAFAGRVIDTPISEAGAFGIAVGAAMTGLRPIFEVMFGDFLTLVMDQLVNQAAKIHYMSNGNFTVPLVLRTTMGTGANLGPQHSQSLYAWAAHVPGLKVVIPSTPADAKGLFKSAIRDDNPVLVFEDRLLYGMKGDVPEGEVLVPLGRADIKRRGRDVTVVALGRMVQVALSAAARLAQEGIEAEIVDPRSLVPLDVETLVESVKRTNRALIVDGGSRQYGAAGELAATLGETAFDWLDAPVARLAAADVPIPMSRTLEPLVQPDEGRVTAAVRALIGR